MTANESASRPDCSTPEPGTLLVEDPSLRHGFVQLPRQVLYARNLSRDAKLLYAVLLGYAWQAGRCFPGYRRLCHDLGASENMVRKYLRELEQADLLRQKRRGLGRTNLYLLRDLKSAILTVQESPDPSDLPRAAEIAGPEPPGWQVLKPRESHDQAGAAVLAVQDPSRAAAPGAWESAHLEPAQSTDKVDRIEEEPEEEEVDAIEVFEPSLLASDDEHVSSIRRVFTDLSRELGDVAHAPSNATRAVNLWRRSGLTRYAFLTLAYDARRLTRRYQGKQPRGAAIAAKGAYFFAVLENLLAAQGGGVARDPPGRAEQRDETPQEGVKQPCAG